MQPAKCKNTGLHHADRISTRLAATLSRTRRDGRDASTLAWPAADPDRFTFAFLVQSTQKYAYQSTTANANAGPCIACHDQMLVSSQSGRTALDACCNKHTARDEIRFAFDFTLQARFLH
jgi:hypothetical protein